MKSALRPVLEHLVGAAMVMLAVAPWLQVTSMTRGYTVVWGAAALAVIVGATVTHATRVGVGVGAELAVSVTALVVFLLVVVVGDPLGYVEVARGLRDGVPRILSTTLPILDVRWAAVPGAVVAWSAGAIATSSIARRGSVALPVGIAFAAFVSGYAVTLGGGSGDPTTMGIRAAAGLAVLSCLLAALRADRAVLAGQWRRALGRGAAAVAVVLVSVVAAVMVVEHAPYLPDDPVEPRIVPEAALREPTSPTLVTRRLRGDSAEQVVGSVRVDAAWSGYVPIAVLQGYDGRVWRIGRDRFDPTGGTLPVELPVGGGPVASFDAVDTRATGGWLPFVGRVATVDGVSVLHNGDGAFQLAESATTVSYRLGLAQPSRQLADDDLPDDAEVAAGTSTPISVPTSTSDRRPAGERLCRFLAFSRDGEADPAIDGVPCGSRAPRDVAFLRELARTLRDGRSIQEDLVGGDQLDSGSEALHDLLELVGAARGPGAVGTPEQFASAFALMADDFGIPVRLATGFRLEQAQVDDAMPLVGGQAWTWVEVPVQGHGWVVIDPSPSAEDAVEQEELDEVVDADEVPEVVEEERTLVGVDPSQTIGSPPPAEDEPNRWLYALAGLPLLPLLVVAATWSRRSLRRWRRRRGTDRQRVIGAWHETIDRVYDAGMRDVESLSGRELTDLVVGVAPWLGPELDELVGAANRAIFSSRPVSDVEVGRAWEIARTVRRDLRRLASRHDRLRALAAPPPRELTAHLVREPVAAPSGLDVLSGVP